MSATPVMLRLGVMSVAVHVIIGCSCANKDYGHWENTTFWSVVTRDGKFIAWPSQDSNRPFTHGDATWKSLNEFQLYVQSHWKDAHIFVNVYSIAPADQEDEVCNSLEKADVRYGVAYLWRYRGEAAKSWAHNWIASLPPD